MDYYRREHFFELAKELELQDLNGRYEAVIKNLKDLEYDDFANQQFYAPKLQMIEDFTVLGRQDIVERVKRGEFDQ